VEGKKRKGKEGGGERRKGREGQWSNPSRTKILVTALALRVGIEGCKFVGLPSIPRTALPIPFFIHFCCSVGYIVQPQNTPKRRNFRFWKQRIVT